MASFKSTSVSVSVSDSFSGISDSINVLVGLIISVSDSFTGLIDSIWTRFGWGNQSKNTSNWNNQSKS